MASSTTLRPGHPPSPYAPDEGPTTAPAPPPTTRLDRLPITSALSPVSAPRSSTPLYLNGPDEPSLRSREEDEEGDVEESGGGGLSPFGSRSGSAANLGTNVMGDTGRRRSSGSSRRMVDGREETREERRVRKDRERAARGEGATDELSPNSRRHRSRPSDSSIFASPPPVASTSTLRRPSLTSTAPTSPSNSSKSVLTIALQRAQSAVLLDSANNVPAAIAAYTQSVRLLKEVMARVEDSGRGETSGRRASAPRDGETEEEREKRIVKNDRKEMAKGDEARRLKVIHDTYEDRIRMLVSMGSEGAEGSSEEGVVTSTSSTSASTQPSPPPSSTSTSPSVPRLPRHRAEWSLESLTTALSDTSPSPIHSSSTSPRYLRSTPSVDALRSSSIASTREEGSRSSSSRGPPVATARALPVLQSVLQPNDGDRTPTTLADLTDQGDESPVEGSAGGARWTGNGDSSREAKRLTPTMMRRKGSTTEEVSHRRTGSDSTGPATSAYRLPNIFALKPPSPLNSHRPPPMDLSLSSLSIRKDSAASTVSSIEAPMITAIDHGGWPGEDADAYGRRESVGMGVSMSDPGQTRRRLPVIDREEGISRSSAADEQRRDSAISSRDRSGSSSSSVQRSTSTESLSSRGTSSYGGMSRLSAFTNVNPTVPEESSPPPTSSIHGSPIRPRPVRSASMASPGYGGVVPRRESIGNRSPISPTTSLGTISQRRRSPLESLERSAELMADDQYANSRRGMERRPSSTEPTIEYQFGALPRTSPSSSYANASLPMRLRTLSQPGRRPSYPFNNDTNIPAVPPLGVGLNMGRSVSGGPSTYTRAAASPTINTSLAAPLPPQLGRSNSSSSQSSFSERERGISPFPRYADTPTSAAFPRAHLAVVPATTFISQPPPPTDGAFANVSAIRRPFYLMRQILASMDGGAYVTPRLYIPKTVWTQSGVKLVAVETKVRMLDLLLTGIEGVERAGNGLLDWRGGDVAREVKGLLGELEGFEGLLEGIQSTLGKKLGYATSGKKVNATSFSAWSSKLSRSLDRVTNGRSLDSPATYVEGIARVFKQAQVFDQHLVSLVAQDGAYARVDPSEQQRTEAALRRASDFFAQVICRFILRDLGVLLDKYVKRSG